jgi:outer membrane immunogenic protein
MKKFPIVGIALLAFGLVGPAVAADMPFPGKAPPRLGPAPIPFYSWTGPYVGLNAGYAWGRNRLLFPGPDSRVNSRGWLVGATAGYNFQFSGAVVAGIEGDIDWTRIRRRTNNNCAPGCEIQNNWLGTARARIGYAFDRWLPYVTGGAAFGNVRARTNGNPFASSTRFGWVAGAGLEVAAWGNVTAKAEYNYVDLGRAACPAANCGVAARAEFKAHIAKVGLNYRF